MYLEQGTVLKIPDIDTCQAEIFVPVIPVISQDSMVNSSLENSFTTKPNLYKYKIAYILAYIISIISNSP